MKNSSHESGLVLHGNPESFREFERLAQQVLKTVAGARCSRTRDAVEVCYECDGETFVVLLTPDAVELRLPTVDWVTPYTPVLSSKLWKRVALEKLQEGDLPKLIAGAGQAYAKTLRTCRYCKQKFPPCHMISRKTCHGCASKHEGVVF